MRTTIKDETQTQRADINEYTTVKSSPQHKTESQTEKQSPINTEHEKRTAKVEPPSTLDIAADTELDDTHVIAREELLQRLLVTAETGAQRVELSHRKWQLASLVSILLLIPTLAVTVWLFVDTSTMRMEQARLRMDNYTFTEQLQTSSFQLDNLTRRLDLLTNQNIRLTVENSRLKTRQGSPLRSAQSPAPPLQPVRSKTVAGKPQPELIPTPQIRTVQATQQTPAPAQLRKRRLDDIKAGAFPANMTKPELVAAIGQPDRVYKSNIYEQLLYFNRSPGRFWFTDNLFISAAK